MFSCVRQDMRVYMKFIITVDTEADNQWKIPSKLSVNNLKYIPRFQSLCENYNLPVTYLVTHEVASSKFAKKLFLPWVKKATCEIGAHLHPWSYNKKMSDVIDSHPYPYEYNFKDLQIMIENLTFLIKNTFNVKPVSYRAGRYGICSNQIRILSNLGYKIDTSVTPNIRWQNSNEKRNEMILPPNFMGFKSDIYNINSEDISKEGDSGIMEIPITTLKTPQFYRRLKKIIKKQNYYIQFRITPETSFRDLKKIIIKSIGKDKEYIMLFLHSSELMAGGSPYFKTKSSIEKMYEQYCSLFKYINESKVQGCLLKDMIKKNKRCHR